MSAPRTFKDHARPALLVAGLLILLFASWLLGRYVLAGCSCGLLIAAVSGLIPIFPGVLRIGVTWLAKLGMCFCHLADAFPFVGSLLLLSGCTLEFHFATVPSVLTRVRGILLAIGYVLLTWFEPAYAVQTGYGIVGISVLLVEPGARHDGAAPRQPPAAALTAEQGAVRAALSKREQ